MVVVVVVLAVPSARQNKCCFDVFIARKCLDAYLTFIQLQISFSFTIMMFTVKFQ